MTEQESLPTYTLGDTIRMPVELRDKSGVTDCYANFYRMENPEDPASLDYDNVIMFEGNGQGKTDVIVELTAEVGGQALGVYWCSILQAKDSVGNFLEMDDPGIKLRIVETPGADYDVPQLVRVHPLTK